MSVVLRPYQEQAVSALLADARTGICPVGVIPTGGGKTVVMRELSSRWLRQSPQDYLLLLAHRTRLLTQAQERFAGVPVQVVSAGLGLFERPQPGTVTVASIQTLAGMPEIRDVPWSLVLVDEAHRVGMDNEESGQYRTFLDALAARSDPPIVGMTATPWRIEKGNRHVPIFGEGSIFQKASCWIHPDELIAQGFLLSPTLATVRHPLPATGVQLPHGEIATANVTDYKKTDFALRIDEMVRLTQDRHRVLVFAESLSESAAIAKALELLGESACVLHGEHPESVRNREIEKFRAGDFKYLVNVDVFTEGLDVPEIDAVVLHRRTQSVVRYLQMAGRGLRPGGRGADCLIVDFGQHVERLGPIEAARGRNALPKSWRSRRLRRSLAEAAHTADWIGEPDAVPDFTEAEAGFCVRVQRMQVIPLPVRGNRAFYLLKFWVDDPGGGPKPLSVEQKLHLWDSALQQLLRRFSALSGVKVPGYGTVNKGEAWAEAVQRMTRATTGFLAYQPYAVRMRWSGRSGKWMVDGWQWSGRAKMDISLDEERLLSAWVQRTGSSPDPLDRAVYQLLYRLAHEGVLDVRLDAPGNPERPPSVPQSPTPPPATTVPKPAEANPPLSAASDPWGRPPSAPRSFPPIPAFAQEIVRNAGSAEPVSEGGWPEPSVTDFRDTGKPPSGLAETAWGQPNRLPPEEDAQPSRPALPSQGFG